VDDRTFDRLARLLGEATNRRAGLKALAGGILGAGGLAALDVGTDATRKVKDKVKVKDKDRDRGSGHGAGAEKRRKTCKPACAAGFTCEKVGKKRQCVCSTGVECGAACCALGQSCVDGQCRAAACEPACGTGYVCEGTTCVCPTGIACADACCAAGQTCQDGTCTGQPEPDRCIPAGEPCKQVGRQCCGGRVCSSGQGGERDVACYVPKTGACRSSADCVFGTSCADGRCAPLPPPPPPPPDPVSQLGAACNPQTNVCTAPGTVCTPYTGDHPVGLSGSYCTLPLGMTCTGDPDCTCYSCGYPEGSFAGRAGRSRRDRRESRAARPKACCGPSGFPCGKDGDCCEDHACSAGLCTPKTGCTVCKTGDCLYDTIEDAIDAGVRDIRVGSGVYDEHDLPAPAGASLRIRPCGTATVVIDANQQGRIMEPIPSGTTVTIQGITVRNGNATTQSETLLGNGGAFDVQMGGALALVGATVADCTAEVNGGGIHVDRGTFEATDSAVLGCSALQGGGVWLRRVPEATLTNCRIEYNAAAFVFEKYPDTGNGGGLGIDASEGTGGGGADDPGVLVSGGSISSNIGSPGGGDSVALGGGVFVHVGPIKVRLHDVTIARNEVKGTYQGLLNGGGVTAERYDYGTSTLGGPGTLVISGRSVIEHNLAPSFGAGVYSSYADVTLEGDTVVRNNRSTTSSNLAAGGGVHLYGGTSPADPLLGSLTVKDNVVIERNKAILGGGIFALNSAVTVEGAAIIRYNGPVCDPSEESCQTEGGGVYLNGGTMALKGSASIRDNYATSGGGIYVDDGGALTVSGNVVVRNNDSAFPARDGIYAYTEGASVICSGTTARVCGNPDANATGASNCNGDGTFSSDCDTVCVGKPKDWNVAGACP